jgi:hypothetical protein
MKGRGGGLISYIELNHRVRVQRDVAPKIAKKPASVNVRSTGDSTWG